jgi:nickel-type superoxide dismutase maturation protease
MLRIIKVAGDSLSPKYEEGDFVVIATVPFFFNSFRLGDIIVFQHPVYGRMIKQVERISSDGSDLYVIGSHPNSVDSRQFGPIPRSSVQGKVIWHIPRPRS